MSASSISGATAQQNPSMARSSGFSTLPSLRPTDRRPKTAKSLQIIQSHAERRRHKTICETHPECASAGALVDTATKARTTPGRQDELEAHRLAVRSNVCVPAADPRVRVRVDTHTPCGHAAAHGRRAL
jgi:hypothetical protein